MVYNMGIKQKRRWSNLHEAIAKRGTLTRELRGLTFEHVSPDDLMYGCGFLQQDRLEDSQRYIDLHYQYLESGTPEEKVQKVYTKLKDCGDIAAVESGACRTGQILATDAGDPAEAGRTDGDFP